MNKTDDLFEYWFTKVVKKNRLDVSPSAYHLMKEGFEYAYNKGMEREKLL